METVDGVTGSSPKPNKTPRRRLRQEPGGRNESVTVRISRRELDGLEEMAANDGVSIQRLMLERTFARKTMTATEVQVTRREFRTARRQVGASMARLDDAIAASHGLGPELSELVREATQALQQLRAAQKALPKAVES